MKETSRTGFEAPPITVEIERGRLRLFCKAIGETGSVFTDPEAARAAGYRDIIAPPTFASCLDADRQDGFSLVRELGLPLAKLLHGSQSITHHGTLSPGDRVVVRSRVSDMYEKKGGALQFVVIQTQVSHQDSAKVVDLERTLIVRQ